MDFDKDPSTLGFQMQDDDEPHERGVLKTGTPRVICAKPMRRGEALVEVNKSSVEAHVWLPTDTVLGA